MDSQAIHDHWTKQDILHRSKRLTQYNSLIYICNSHFIISVYCSINVSIFIKYDTFKSYQFLSI